MIKFIPSTSILLIVPWNRNTSSGCIIIETNNITQPLWQLSPVEDTWRYGSEHDSFFLTSCSCCKIPGRGLEIAKEIKIKKKEKKPSTKINSRDQLYSHQPRKLSGGKTHNSRHWHSGWQSRMWEMDLTVLPSCNRNSTKSLINFSFSFFPHWDLLVSHCVWKRIACSGSRWDRGPSGCGAGELALACPAWLGRLDQMTSKVLCKLKHSLSLWPNSSKPTGACTYFGTEQRRLSSCHDNRETLMITLKTDAAYSLVAMCSHWRSLYNLLFAPIDRYSPAASSITGTCTRSGTIMGTTITWHIF